jgi:(p)ppGpp synthase/HD superfamily hydrolase
MYKREPMVSAPAAASAAVSPEPLPDLALRSATICAAYQLAREAHGGPGHGDTKLSHPVAVAELLVVAGFGETEISAALLHDTVEDTALGIGQIEASFDADIGGLVAGLTEDLRIDRYPPRKAEARARAVQDRRVAAIYAADKLANTRRLLGDAECVEGERLDHYVKTLRLFSEQIPDLPFLAELSAELTRLIDRDAGRIGAPAPRLQLS